MNTVKFVIFFCTVFFVLFLPVFGIVGGDYIIVALGIAGTASILFYAFREKP